MKVMRTQMIGGLPKINMGIYAKGGVGKTTLMKGVCSDPRTSPALWLDAMGNPQLYILNGEIPYGFTIEEYQDIKEPLDYLTTGQNKRHSFYRQYKDLLPDEPFKSVVIDTMTFIQQLLIDYVIKQKPPKSGVKDVQKVDAMYHGAEIAGETMRLTRSILSLPIHTFMSYQLMDKMKVTDTGSGQPSFSTEEQLALYGQSRGAIPPWHSLLGVLRLENQAVTKEVNGRKKVVKEQVQTIYWRDPEATGKNQLSPSLGTELVDPTMGKILDFIEQDWKGKE